jgi:hypothetical protein
VPTTHRDKSLVFIDRDLQRLARKVRDEAPAYRWRTWELIDRKLDARLRLMRNHTT